MRPAAAVPEHHGSDAGKRIEWLDALRGWAILLVILVHSGQDVTGLSGGWKAFADAGQYGVQLFFVVSALTIGLTYERQLRNNPDAVRASLAWLVKRYFRIAPLYYYGIALYLIVFAAMRTMGSHLAPNTPWDVVANLLFIHSWVPSAQNTVVPGGWSIGVEMCFYLAAPFIFLGLRSTRASLIALIVSVAIAMGLDHVIAWMSVPGNAVANNSFLYFWFPTQVPVFMAGTALYRGAGRHLWSPDPPPFGLGIYAACSGVLFGAIGLAFGTVGNLDHAAAPAAIGLAFCALAILIRTTVVESILVSRATVWLGRISYSVYVNHFLALLALRFIDKRLHLWDQWPAPLALLAVFAAAVAITAPLSMLTRRVTEIPGIEIGRRLAAAIEARYRSASRAYPR